MGQSFIDFANKFVSEPKCIAEIVKNNFWHDMAP